jgi:toxin-antitoxin system PIN domain toxin
MRALLDVNVLIALHDMQHVHHALAAEWFEAHADAGWASCPLTQNGCARIMSQPAYPNAQKPGDLLRLLAASFAAPFHEFWADDISLADTRHFRADRIHGPRQLTDIYLLGLAVQHGGRFVTFDGGIALAAVHRAQARHLVALMRS